LGWFSSFLLACFFLQQNATILSFVGLHGAKEDELVNSVRARRRVVSSGAARF